jgi:ABC-type glutathione transport system ATPase component
LVNACKRKKRDESEDSSVRGDDDESDFSSQGNKEVVVHGLDTLMNPLSDADMCDDDVSKEAQSEADSDDSGLQDEDMEDYDEGGYDVTTEEMRNHPVYDKNFAQVETDLAKMAMKVIKIIKQSGCQNDRANGCLEKARWLLNLPDTKKELIALIGESGVGKSSLINSLLSIPKLARAVSTYSERPKRAPGPC